MLDRPRPLVAVALLLVLLLPAVRPDQAPAVAPADAERHEGRRVRVQGVVADLRPRADGTVDLTLAADGAALDVRVPHAVRVGRGGWAEAEGTLLRWNGVLRLHADRLDAAPPSGPAQPSWGELAADPGAWTDRLLRVSGEVRGGALRADGHALALGDGPWRGLSGPVVATGVLAYDAACLCHRLHAQAVAPWNP